MTVYILRGVPGSGKSTFAKNIDTDTAVICSADDFFVGEDGVYRFDASKISQAHKECFLKFVRAVNDGKKTIVIDNTNCTNIEVAPYVTYAEAMGHTATIIAITKTPPEECAARNVHGVPEATVMRMYRTLMENIRSAPRWWVQI